MDDDGLMRVARWLLNPKPLNVFVGDKSFHEAAIGNGPVNTMDNGCRKALVANYPSLADIKLVDYVRILDTAGGQHGYDGVVGSVSPMALCGTPLASPATLLFMVQP